MLNSYSNCIAWLFNRFPSYQNQGAPAYKPGLENTKALLAQVGNPQNDLAFIHIAGTNGKGSTCAFMASILQQKGYRVGLFTSPHLVDFRERIRVNGRPILQKDVIHFCNQTIEASLDLSFFEITLAMALVHFKNEHCDFVVLETGMGGRLDATNVVTPLLSVITNISYDHKTFLGETLEEIAIEKAGIIKSKIPVICGEKRKELIELFRQKAKEMDAPLVIHNDQIEDQSKKIPQYQRENASIAIKALKILGIDSTHIDIIQTWNNLFKDTGFIGRLFASRLNENLWFDVSHNEEGLQTTLNSFKLISGVKPIIIFGACNDKSLAHLPLLCHEIDRWYFCEFSNQRSYREDQWKEFKEHINDSRVNYFKNVNEAITSALKIRTEEQGILVTGSFFLLSDCAEIQSIVQDQMTP